MRKIEILANIIRVEITKAREYAISAFSFLYIKIYFFCLLVLNIIAWFGAGFIDSKIDKKIIALHYNVDFGINLIGEAKNIYVIPLVGLIIIIVNSILYISLLKNKDRKIISHILFASGIFISFLLLSAITSIYLINFQ